jgi:hypothetical protein
MSALSPAPRRVAKPEIVALLMGALFAAQLGCSEDLPAFDRIILELESARPESNANIVHVSVLGRIDGSSDEPRFLPAPDTGGAMIAIGLPEGALYDRPFHLDLTDFIASFEGEDVQVAVRAHGGDGVALTGGQTVVEAGARGSLSLRLTEGAVVELMEAVCVPEDELCDGLDNDCDGDTDEADMPIPCDDGIPCTSETCSDGACESQGNAEQCNDGEPCTIDECELGYGCRNSIDVQECQGCGSDEDCVNTNVCTTVSCKVCSGAGCPAGFPGRCETSDLAAFCNDGDFCTSPDQCEAGTCVSGPSKFCGDGIGCTIDSCDAQTGACSSAGAEDSPSCNDGVECTLDGCDVEQGCFFDLSECTCQTDEQCPDDGNQCTAQVCKGGGCVVENEPLGAQCDAEVACASTVACDGSGACAIDELVALGTPCDDFDVCTDDDRCDPDGKCIGGIPLELCNNLDDDCDGEVDEGILGIDKPCDSELDEDYCEYGALKCDADGALVCFGDWAADPQVCNGADDDCDGEVDEGFPVGQPCNEVEGQASCYVLVCDPNDNEHLTTVCVPIGEASGLGVEGPDLEPKEVCNGFDDDCDGNIDEGLACEDTQCNLTLASESTVELDATVSTLSGAGIVLGTTIGAMLLTGGAAGIEGLALNGFLQTQEPVSALAYLGLFDLLVLAQGQHVVGISSSELEAPMGEMIPPKWIDAGGQVIDLAMIEDPMFGGEAQVVVATTQGLNLHSAPFGGMLQSVVTTMVMSGIVAVSVSPLGFAGSLIPAIAVLRNDPAGAVQILGVMPEGLVQIGIFAISNPTVVANVGADQAIFIVGSEDGGFYQVSYSQEDGDVVMTPLGEEGINDLRYMGSQPGMGEPGDPLVGPLVVGLGDGTLRAASVTVQTEGGPVPQVTMTWGEDPISVGNSGAPITGVSVLPFNSLSDAMVITSGPGPRVDIWSITGLPDQPAPALEPIAEWDFSKQPLHGVVAQEYSAWLAHETGLVNASLDGLGNLTLKDFLPMAGGPRTLALDPTANVLAVALADGSIAVLNAGQPSNVEYLDGIMPAGGGGPPHLTALGNKNFLVAGGGAGVSAFTMDGATVSPWMSSWTPTAGKVERASATKTHLWVTTDTAELHQCPFSMQDQSFGASDCPSVKLADALGIEDAQIYDMVVRDGSFGTEVYLALGTNGVGRFKIQLGGSIAESDLQILESGAEPGFVRTLAVRNSRVWTGTADGRLDVIDCDSFSIVATLEGTVEIQGIAPTEGGAIVARTSGAAEGVLLQCN